MSRATMSPLPSFFVARAMTPSDKLRAGGSPRVGAQ